MYRICYSNQIYGGQYYVTIENCTSFAEAEQKFKEDEIYVACFICAIEKL